MFLVVRGVNLVSIFGFGPAYGYSHCTRVACTLAVGACFACTARALCEANSSAGMALCAITLDSCVSVLGMECVYNRPGSKFGLYGLKSMMRHVISWPFAGIITL